MRCENCGNYDDCLIVDSNGDEIIVLADEPELYGTVLCPDCYSMIYRRGWNEDWYREDGWL